MSRPGSAAGRRSSGALRDLAIAGRRSDAVAAQADRLPLGPLAEAREGPAGSHIGSRMDGRLMPAEAEAIGIPRKRDGDPYENRTRVFAVRAEPIWLSQTPVDALKLLIFLNFVGKLL